MRPDPKPKTVRDKKHLDAVRELPCCKCGKPFGIVPHHEPGKDSGMGLKTSDMRSVPLCYECHGMRHTLGKVSFWGNLDVERVITETNRKLKP